jgi:ClpP class serine protease
MSNDIRKVRDDFLKQYRENYPATARLEHYRREAQKYREGNEVVDVLVEVTVDEKETKHTNLTRHPVRELEIRIGEAQQALDKGDIDHFAQAFEQVIRHTVELNLPEHDKVMERANQSKRANVRAESYATLKKQAIKLYENGNWNSPRAASIALAKELSPAQRTIYEWLREHVKDTT